MKVSRHITHVLLMALTCSLFAACGSTSSSSSDADSLQTDVTQPSNPMQSALSEINDSVASSEADTGATTSLDQQSSGNEALYADQKSGCVAVVTNPSPLDPNNLPSQFSIAWTYTNCARSPRGGTINGTRSVAVTLDGNRTATQTFALERAYIDGADLTSDGNSVVVTDGNRASGAVTRNVTGDGNRVFTGPAGNERFNHTYSHSLTISDTYVASNGNSPALSQRVINGSGQLNHNIIQAVSQTILDAITYQPSCAWPVSGSLTISTTFKNGSVATDTYVWSAPCGTVTVGKADAVTLSDTP